jgi:hypothetical protein
VFHGKKVNATDQYIYQSVNYSYEKDKNLITASVSGTNKPISVGGI